jgi:hypothetical protein
VIPRSKGQLERPRRSREVDIMTDTVQLDFNLHLYNYVKSAFQYLLLRSTLHLQVIFPNAKTTRAPVFLLENHTKITDTECSKCFFAVNTQLQIYKCSDWQYDYFFFRLVAWI